MQPSKKNLFSSGNQFSTPKMDFRRVNNANISFDADISPITDGKNSPFLRDSGMQGENINVAEFSDSSPMNGFNRIVRKKLSTDLEIKATMDEIKEIENKSAKFNYEDKDIIFFEDQTPQHQPTFRKRNFSNVDDNEEVREETEDSKSTKVIKFMDNPLISFDDPNLFKNVIQHAPSGNPIQVSIFFFFKLNVNADFNPSSPHSKWVSLVRLFGLQLWRRSRN
jgi:hypothetical protein